METSWSVHSDSSNCYLDSSTCYLDYVDYWSADRVVRQVASLDLRCCSDLAVSAVEHSMFAD